MRAETPPKGQNQPFTPLQTGTEGEGRRPRRYITFHMAAEVAVPRRMFAEILSLIARLRAPPTPA
jgi:hypothetical protein